jgi:hypothetical protein
VVTQVALTANETHGYAHVFEEGARCNSPG